LTSLYSWGKIFLVTGETLRGEPKGQIPKLGTKLSGKRTVTYLNPGKIQKPFDFTQGWTPKGKNPDFCGIISQVKRQEEGARA